MALVRISRELIKRVTDVIQSMENRALTEAAGGNAQCLPTELNAAVQEAAWSLAPNLRALTPVVWKCEKTDCDAHFLKEGSSKEYITYVRAQVGNGPKFDLPGVYKDRYCPDVNIPYDIWTTKPSLAGYVQYYLNKIKVKVEVEDKYRSIRQQVTQFLRSRKSLNDAAKAWPGVLLYVPSDIKEELERKVERAKREKEETPECNIDMEALTALGAAHLIGGGS